MNKKEYIKFLEDALKTSIRQFDDLEKMYVQAEKRMTIFSDAFYRMAKIVINDESGESQKNLEVIVEKTITLLENNLCLNEVES